MPLLHRAVPVKFFLYCLASTESKSCGDVGLGNLRLHPAVGQVREARVADHVARVARDHQAAGVSLFAVRDSCVERLFVCTNALSLIMISLQPSAPGRLSRSGCPAAAALGRCQGPRCCWTLAACSSSPSSLSERDRPRSRSWSR